MRSDDELILRAWAQGLSGASARLSRRAWLVLKNEARTDPKNLTKAWGDAASAQQWIRAFNAMGLAGLMDAPRDGRPAHRISSEIEASLESLDVESAREAAMLRIRQLDHSTLDAIWRQNRITGRVLQRRHRFMDLPVPVPDGLTDLAGVYLSDGLAILATANAAKLQLDQLQGRWLSLGSQYRHGVRHVRGGYDLMTALRLRPAVPAAAVPAPGSSRERRVRESKVNDALLDRMLEALRRRSDQFPGKLSVEAIVDLTGPPRFIRFLNNFRKHSLWRPTDQRHPTTLKHFGTRAHAQGLPMALQRSIASLLPHVSAVAATTLLDCLCIERTDEFAWIRVDDERGDSEGLEWDPLEERDAMGGLSPTSGDGFDLG